MLSEPIVSVPFALLLLIVIYLFIYLQIAKQQDMQDNHSVDRQFEGPTRSQYEGRKTRSQNVVYYGRFSKATEFRKK